MAMRVFFAAALLTILSCADDAQPTGFRLDSTGTGGTGDFVESGGFGGSSAGGTMGAGTQSGGSPQSGGTGGAGPLFCGNGVVEPGETCDDDGTIDGDGCSAECLLEPGTACGDAVNLNGSAYAISNTRARYSGTTAGETLINYSAPSCSDATLDKKTTLLRYTLPTDGSLSVRTRLNGGLADTVLWANLDCQNPADELACSDDVAAFDDSSRIDTGELPADSTLFLALSGGGSSDSDAYQIDLSLYAPAVGPGTCAQPIAVNEQKASARTVDTFSGLSGSCSGNGPEALFLITLNEPSALRLTAAPAGGNQDIGIYLLEEDCFTEVADSCVDEAGPGSVESVLLAQLAAGSYFAVIDAVLPIDTGLLHLDVEPLAILDAGATCAPESETEVCEIATNCLGSTTPKTCVKALWAETFDENLGSFSFVDAGSDGIHWTACDAANCGPNRTRSATRGGYARISDTMTASLDNEILISPAIAAPYDHVELAFHHRYRDYSLSSDQASVEVSADGNSWTTVAAYSDDAEGKVTLDVSNYVAQGAGFYVRFVYDDQTGGGDPFAIDWSIDDVMVFGY